MCGICGIIGPANPSISTDQAETAVRRMLATLRHRGPDDEGLLVSSTAVLGIRRLSIIDLVGGAQPVWNENRTVAALCNGEIYNFISLREELASLGHRFASRCDTEVLAHAWEEWGTDLCTHLRGMFAFAIAELPEGPTGGIRRVFLTRDRLGIKPLYYSVQPQGLLFASEVCSLVASGYVPAQLSRAELEAYLLFGSVCEPATLIEGVSSLPPGHCLDSRMDDKRAGTLHSWCEAEPHPWWNPALLPAQISAPAEKQPRAALKRVPQSARALREILEASVREHLIADVPLGVFLSSGIDSTAIAALASREQRGIRTLTVAFSEKNFSEAEIARRTAVRLGTDHTERLVTGQEMLARLEEAVSAMDQPTMDGVNTWFVSEAARAAGLKVALSGLGSDELFGGYSTFRSAPRLARIAQIGAALPSRQRRALAAAAMELPVGSSRLSATRKVLAAWAEPDQLPHSYFFSRLLFIPAQVRTFLCGEFAAPLQSTWRQWLASAANQTVDANPFAAISWLELRSYLVNTLLRDTDSTSMHHSLEVRVPFLDHRVVEFALQCSQTPQTLLRAKPGKALLIKALGGLLPAEIVAQKKRTFTLPWEHWLRGPLRARVTASFSDPAPALVATVDFCAVNAIWQDFLRGRTTWSRPWSLFVLNEWARRHISAGT
jgi:asparagine synthase (glutamine-hydrolysing)